MILAFKALSPVRWEAQLDQFTNYKVFICGDGKSYTAAVFIYSPSSDMSQNVNLGEVETIAEAQALCQAHADNKTL